MIIKHHNIIVYQFEREMSVSRKNLSNLEYIC